MKNFKTFIFAFFFLALSTQVAKAQVSFAHSAGLALFGGGDAFSSGLTYSPRLNFFELGKEATLSVGTHLTFGFQFQANSRTGSSSSFGYDVPLLVEANFGHASSKETESSFGGFVGLGYGINKIGSTTGGDNDAQGLVLNGGLRFIVQNFPVGIRGAYLLNNKEGFSDIFLLGAFFSFGKY